MISKSQLLLAASLLVGIGGWMVTLKTWADACLPVQVGGLIMVIGSIVAAWLGKSPLKGQQ